MRGASDEMNTETQHTAHNGQQAPAAPHGYAGFWNRFSAFFIDAVILGAMAYGAASALDVICGICPQVADCAGFIRGAVGVVMIVSYFVWFESSPAQATPGKMAFGMKVTDANGNRISARRATGRLYCKLLSALPFLGGYIMIACTRKKRSLHDILAGCLVVNKAAPTSSQAVTVSLVSVVGAFYITIGVSDSILYPMTSSVVRRTVMNAMVARAKDIRAAIEDANETRAPLGLGSVWPKTGQQTGTGDDIGSMRFENSSDYFTVLFDGMRLGAPDWSPYVSGCDYTKCSGGGVPAKMEAGLLTAQNNAWIVAANVTGDMPDSLPVIISRNVDPASLIPGKGDLREQRVRPSGKFLTPFGNKGFVMVRKGGAIVSMRFGRHSSLATVYQGADARELQRIRDALQKVEYLTP